MATRHPHHGTPRISQSKTSLKTGRSTGKDVGVTAATGVRYYILVMVITLPFLFGLFQYIRQQATRMCFSVFSCQLV
jgi:hypothetical protein